MAFPYEAILSTTVAYGIAKQAFGGPFPVTQKAFLGKAVVGKQLGLTQAPSGHLSRMGLKAETAIHYTEQKPAAAAPTGPRGKAPTLGL